MDQPERVRYFFEIAYDGANYNGWQSQANAIGIQTVVEEKLSMVFRTQVKIVASGRTDTGVHCEQQYFHADLSREIDPELFIAKVNSIMPPDISIQSIRKVRPDASARYDAIERVYRYQITRRKNPFMRQRAWHFFKPVDIQTMNEAAALLRGEHDFECFSKVKTDVNHFLCNIRSAEWREKGDMLIFTISANRFLRGMVRAIVGTLLDIGTGKTSMQEFRNIIQSKDRKKAGANVPSYGLYLMKVKYRSTIFIK
ncbi:MAG TPA: tRNA pseudouridine(38-40) synthase TruA [Chryseosolibacter sp.]|nr:tRNA pseudouridine(38-40) synthase TruA [Chryseosolibacter sp.]